MKLSALFPVGIRSLILMAACCMAAGCGTSLSGRLDGQRYVSPSGEIACTFANITPETVVQDYSRQDGEWVSSNRSGTDVQRVERFVVNQGTVPAFQNVEALVENVLPRYMGLTQQIKGSRAVVVKPIALGKQTGIYTLVEFKTVDQRYDPPESIDYRGILWLLGEKYGTSLHVYNWRYQEKDADKIEARLMEFYKGCTLKG